MPKYPTIINFSKHRTRHLYLKYYDNLKTHLGHFEHNLIGLGYTFDCDILRHQISIGNVTATVIELGGELICLAEVQFTRLLFSHYMVLEWLERFAVHFQPEHYKEFEIHNASHIIAGVRFRQACIVIYRKGHSSLTYNPEAFEIVTSQLDAFTDDFDYFDGSGGLLKWQSW